MGTNDIALLNLSQLTEFKLLLRPVNTESVDYLEMVESIRSTGLWNSICVRPIGDDKYEVIDGNYRVACCREVGFDPVPAIIRHGLSDEEVIAAQIRANAVRPETTPVEFARQLRRIQKAFPNITLAELSRFVNKNPTWVSRQLDLLKLNKHTQQLVNEGVIPLESAVMLAKVPSRLRNSLVSQAASMRVSDFKRLAGGVIKRFMECVAQGRLEDELEQYVLPFQPTPYLRSLKEILHELEHRENAGPVILAMGDVNTAIEGFYAGLTWVCHMDPEGIEEQQRRATLRQKADLRQLYRERDTDDVIDDEH